MELRRHSSVTFRGGSAWPPAFGGSYGPGTIFPQGEQGTIVDVDYRDEAHGTPSHIFVTIEFSGHVFSGCLIVDDRALLPFLAYELKRFKGRPLTEAGSIDLDAALDSLREKIRAKLRSGTLPRTLGRPTAPLQPGQPPTTSMQIGTAAGQVCAGCDQPILPERPRASYVAAPRPIVLDELCERISNEEQGWV